MKAEGMFFYNKERQLEEYLQVVSHISYSCMPEVHCGKQGTACKIGVHMQNLAECAVPLQGEG
ncbi:hypothetical protein AWN68_02665 [Roseivirga echinicomitans]|uniref:Uncharacterized protein n=1 Tax=Roseivirga echinicomitans TaxID=296218 RepID=A0A150XYH8_9BACT|nr:hypothetical protein AWN68_02665 [Roseivirga echinicomitans]